MSADNNARSKPKSFVPLFEILGKAALNLRRLALDRYLQLRQDIFLDGKSFSFLLFVFKSRTGDHSATAQNSFTRLDGILTVFRQTRNQDATIVWRN
jgi:hypothetical protein